MSDAFEMAKKNLCFESVCLRSSHVELKEDSDARSWGDLSITTQSYKGTSAFVEEQVEVEGDSESSPFWIYTFMYNTALRTLPEDEEALTESPDFKPLIEIKVVWAARYISKEQIDPDGLKEFSVDNVGYHVWPYWREYVQSTSFRMGIVEHAPRVPLYQNCSS